MHRLVFFLVQIFACQTRKEHLQCVGEAEYVNDIPSLPNELHAAVVLSKTGPAKLEGIDISAIKVRTEISKCKVSCVKMVNVLLISE